MRRLREEEDKRQNLLSRRLSKEGNASHVSRIIKLLFIVFLVILMLEIWVVNRLTTYGNKIQELKLTRASLELENQILENQIAQISSMLTTETKASLLGFESIKNIEYIKTPNLASAL